MSFDQPFLGRGWSFPPEFNRDLAAVEMTFGVEDIYKSLAIIFTTTLGERVMNPDFGCGLDEMVFEPMNSSMLSYVTNMLKTAILYHEPRIDAQRLEVESNAHEGILWLRVDFTVRGSNSRFNFVFPYYLSEASG